MTAVNGIPLPVKLARRPERLLPNTGLADFLNRLVIPPQMFEADAHPAIQRLVNPLRADCPASMSVRANRVVAKALPALRSRRWPLVIQHGDLAPWNTISHHGEVSAIDWEEGGRDGFPYADLVYYVLQTAYFIHHWDAGRCAAYASEVVRIAMREDAGEIASGVECALVVIGAIDAWRATTQTGQFCSPLQDFRMGVAESAENIIA